MANTGGRYGHTHHVWHMAAATFAVLGKPAQAVGFAAQGERPGLAELSALSHPHFKPLHADPPFLEMLADLRHEWESYRREFGPTLSRLIRRCLLRENFVVLRGHSNRAETL